MKTKQHKTYFALCLIFILQTFLFISCKDDPVTPVTPPAQDTINSYDWSIVDVGGILVDLYVADSTNIYLNTGTIPDYYNGYIVEPFDLQDPTFILNSINGFDKNNIYFGGGNPSATKNPALKKYSNGQISTYTIQSDSTYYIGHILVEGANKAWIGTQGGNHVYLFENSIFTEYNLNDTILYPYFFKDSLGTLYLFAIKKEGADEYLAIYKHVGDVFEFVRKDLINYSAQMYPLLYECGSILVKTSDRDFNKLYYFNGFDWIYYMTTDFEISKLGGYSRNKLIALDIYTNIWLYNDEHWVKEDSVNLNIYGYYYSYGGHVKIKENRIYFVIQYSNFNSKLIIGKPK
ncbi:MAG: hypothetical protein EHM58_15050 [Ignavibacteriae bacterium]|nr:MAG: hypothetical protein EHM58_15050 [Ignavibacteriota bacterium]